MICEGAVYRIHVTSDGLAIQPKIQLSAQDLRCYNTHTYTPITKIEQKRPHAVVGYSHSSG